MRLIFQSGQRIFVWNICEPINREKETKSGENKEDYTTTANLTYLSHRDIFGLCVVLIYSKNKAQQLRERLTEPGSLLVKRGTL